MKLSLKFGLLGFSLLNCEIKAKDFQLPGLLIKYNGNIKYSTPSTPR